MMKKYNIVKKIMALHMSDYWSLMLLAVSCWLNTQFGPSEKDQFSPQFVPLMYQQTSGTKIINQLCLSKTVGCFKTRPVVLMIFSESSKTPRTVWMEKMFFKSDVF